MVVLYRGYTSMVVYWVGGAGGAGGAGSEQRELDYFTEAVEGMAVRDP